LATKKSCVIVLRILDGLKHLINCQVDTNNCNISSLRLKGKNHGTHPQKMF
jgi:hypothetical protein